MNSLTANSDQGYCGGAAANSAAGIDLSITGALALIRSAFFSPEVHGGLYGGSSERRSRVGKVNSVYPATLLIDLNGAGSLTQHENTAMPSTKHPHAQNTPDTIAQDYDSLPEPDKLFVLEEILFLLASRHGDKKSFLRTDVFRDGRGGR